MLASHPTTGVVLGWRSPLLNTHTSLSKRTFPPSAMVLARLEFLLLEPPILIIQQKGTQRIQPGWATDERRGLWISSSDRYSALGSTQDKDLQDPGHSLPPFSQHSHPVGQRLQKYLFFQDAEKNGWVNDWQHVYCILWCLPAFDLGRGVSMKIQGTEEMGNNFAISTHRLI